MAAIIRKYQSDQVERAVNPVPVRAPQTSLGGLGQGLSDVGGMFDKWQDEIDTADAKSADAAYSDLIRQELYADQTGFMYSQGGDSVNLRGPLSERLEAEQKRILDDLSPAARAHAESAMTARYQRALQTVDQHTAGQRRVYLDSASEARITSSIQDAIFNPDDVAQSIAMSDQEIMDLADRNGWAPEVVALRQQEARTAIHAGVIERLESVDPIRALEYLRENKSQMAGAEVARLEGLLVPLVREYRGRQAGQLAAMSGVSETYLSAIRASESGGNDAAQNPNSTATGRYQFLSSTWAGLMKRHPDLGLTADGRFDAVQQERAIRALTKENAETLQSNGVVPTNSNLYAAHFLGAGGAVRVLSGDGDALVSSLVSQDVIDANSFLEGMTVADFRSWTRRKGGGDQVGYSAQAGGIESLLEIADPDERAAAISEYNLRIGIQKKQTEASRDAAADAAFKLIEAGGNINDLPTTYRQHIGREAMTSLRAYQEKLASGQSVQTDDELYVQLSDMIVRDPEQFMQADPMTWRDKLDDGDFQYFVKQRTDLIAGKRADPSLSKMTSQANAAVAALGLGKKDPALNGRLVRHLMEWSKSNPEKASDEFTVYKEASRSLAEVEIDYVFNNVKMRALDIDFAGKTLTDTDDIDPVEFKTQLLEGDVYIQGQNITPDIAQSVFSDVSRVLGREPTPDEFLQALIAKVL